MRARLGVDIGGTFTDLVVIDDATGTARVGKVLTTAKDPAHGVEEGIHALLDEAGVRSDAVRAVVHGTTLATNALIERKGAKIALLTTEGFRDALEIRREGRYDMYDLFIDPPPPLVPRHLRREVPERLLADGSILKTLDEAAARRALAELARDGVEALAICLLHAYVNPAHERRLSEIAREVSPGLSVSCSSEVVPEIRECERASTTCANVYVAPLMARYLEDLERRLAALGIDGQLYIMQSSGGTALPPLARRLPVRLVESGPAAGALAAAQAARERHEPKLLSFDMGGTTAKACVIDDGVPLVGREFEVARADRFKKGSGLPIRVPVIELIEIGAGGGSIARVDRMGLLKVGPDSAGADPGPACYTLGGRHPTVTDADLLLGYLDAEFFLGGRMRLDREAAHRVVGEHVARRLGLDVTGAAWATRPRGLARDQPALRRDGGGGARAPRACGRGAGRHPPLANRRDAPRRSGPRGGVRDASRSAIDGEPPDDHGELRERLPRPLPPAAPRCADRGAQLAPHRLRSSARHRVERAIRAGSRLDQATLGSRQPHGTNYNRLRTGDQTREASLLRRGGRLRGDARL